MISCLSMFNRYGIEFNICKLLSIESTSEIVSVPIFFQKHFAFIMSFDF